MINLLQEAQKIIKINSVSENGTEEIINYAKPIMESLGFKTIVQPVPHSFENVSKRQFNLIGILGDELVDVTTKRGILFVTHLDTGNPGIKDYWTQNDCDPFNLASDNSDVYGLGVADSKIDFLCKLKAVEKFADRKFKMPLYIVATCGYRLGFLGAKYLVKSLAVNPRFVMVSTPTSFKLATKTKSFSSHDLGIEFRAVEKDVKGYNTKICISSYGQAADTSTPHLVDNSIEKLLFLLKALSARSIEFKIYSLNGGYARGVSPDFASMDIFIKADRLNEFAIFFKDFLENGNEGKLYVEYGGVGESGLRFLPDNFVTVLESVETKLNSIGDLLKSKVDNDFNPAESTVVIRKLSVEKNKIVLGLDAFFVPEFVVEDYEMAIRDMVNQLNSSYENISAQIIKKETNKGSNILESTLFVSKLKEALDTTFNNVQDSNYDSEKNLTAKSSITEGSIFAEAGFDVVNFGPANIEYNSGIPSENIKVSEIQNAVKFYQQVIEEICLGE